jgi:hypothetical protein
MGSHSTSRRFRTLVDQLLDDQLTAEEVGELEGLLREDTASQEKILDYCQFHAMLTFDLRAQHLVERVIETRQRENTPTTVRRPASATLAGSNVKLLRTAAWTLAASVMVGISWLGLYKLSTPSVDMGPIASHSSSPRQLWPEITKVEVRDQGTQLTLGGMGTVQLDGQSDFEITGPMRARMTKGRMKCRVTDVASQGFIIETPYGEVVDLGTEFGLDLSSGDSLSVLVFEGEVDLRVPEVDTADNETTVQFADARRLVSGDGVIINASGNVDRLVSVFTGGDATFCQSVDLVHQPQSVIIGVSDNLRSTDTQQFYEVVPGGMDEDARAYVDRPYHEWNGVDADGLPSYLLGADYIKPFNNDKMRKQYFMRVELAVPADIYVLFDNRISPPDWLLEEFEDTGDDVGIDMGPWSTKAGQYFAPPRGRGAGNSIDETVSVWKRKSPARDEFVLGANSGANYLTAMYGVCAVPLELSEVR